MQIEVVAKYGKFLSRHQLAVAVPIHIQYGSPYNNHEKGGGLQQEAALAGMVKQAKVMEDKATASGVHLSAPTIPPRRSRPCLPSIPSTPGSSTSSRGSRRPNQTPFLHCRRHD